MQIDSIDQNSNGSDSLSALKTDIGYLKTQTDSQATATSGVFLNVMNYGATGNGTTNDYQAFRDAIDDLPSLGGTIIIPVPTVSYKINTTIAIDKPVTFKGVTGTKGMFATVGPPLGIIILWGGGANPIFSITQQNGVWFKNILLDGNGVATHGIYIDRLKSGGCDDLYITGCATSAIKFDCGDGVVANNGNFFNRFSSLSIDACPRAIEMVSQHPTTANTCHNLFERVSITFTGDYGIYAHDGDNNTFIDVYSYTGEAGKTLYMGALFYNNYFFHLQPMGGVLVDDGCPGNTIIGYDNANSEPGFSIVGSGNITVLSENYQGMGWYIGGNVGIGTPEFGGGSFVIGMRNASAPGSTPSGGGIIYVSGGALYYKGSSGTATKIANA